MIHGRLAILSWTNKFLPPTLNVRRDNPFSFNIDTLVVSIPSIHVSRCELGIKLHVSLAHIAEEGLELKVNSPHCACSPKIW